MSLSEMTCNALAQHKRGETRQTHILMLEMLKQLQLAVCSLGQDRSAERLHDLLNRDILAGKLIFGGTAHRQFYTSRRHEQITKPDQMLPCPPVGGRSICASQLAVAKAVAVPRAGVPGRDLEGGAEDLCSHELRHGDG